MKSIISFFLLLMSMQLFSQTINQPGEVRSISYQLGIKGTPIADVRIKSLVEVRSDSNGKFVLPVRADGKDYFTFIDIYLAGYELVIPSMDEFRTRRFAINPGVSHTIVMVNRNERNAESNRIAEQLRSKNEEEIEQRENQIAMLNAELQTLRQQNRDANDLERQVDSLQTELQQFRQTYYASEELIRKEAERLSKIDYYELDSLQVVIYNLLKEGRGKEVVQTARSQISDELWNKIILDPGSIKQGMDKKTKQVEQLTRELQQDSLLQEHLAQQLKNMADGFAANFQNDSAAFYLKKRMELDSENLDFTTEYADFIVEYTVLYDEALKLYQICLEKILQRFGNESEETATVYNELGKVFENLGNYTRAMDYYQLALNVNVKTGGMENPATAISYNNIGGILLITADYPRALEYFEKAIEIQQQVNGSENKQLGTTYNNLGYFYYKLADYQKSLEYYKESLDIFMKILPEEHPDIATAYNNIATIYSGQEDYTKVIEYNEKALAIRLKVFGSEHPDVAVSYNNIGLVLYNQGKYQEAIEYYEKSIVIELKTFGQEYHGLGVTYNNLGMAYDNLGNYTKALEYHEKALGLYIKILGENHPSVATSYTNLASVYYGLNQLPKALECYLKALDIRQNILDSDNLLVATSINNAALLYGHMGEYYKAREFFERVLDLYIKLYGEDNNDVNQTRENIRLMNTMLSPHQFVLTVRENGVAYNLGLRGKYVVLHYEGWEIGDNKSIFRHSKNVFEIPKRIVVMANDDIQEYTFGPGQIGLTISVEVISAEEEKRIMEKYDEWKKATGKI